MEKCPFPVVVFLGFTAGSRAAMLRCFRKDSYHHLTSDCEKGGAYHTSSVVNLGRRCDVASASTLTSHCHV